MSSFERYIGIDYSGAEAPTSSLKGLRVYQADRASSPVEVQPPPSPRKYWTRRGIAEWLVERLSEDQPTIVGIDHAFSFPLRYFEVHHIPPDWQIFLDDFQRHWPTDEDNTYVQFVRDGLCGDGKARSGETRWRRLTEVRTGRAKSVFHFDVPGSVAKSPCRIAVAALHSATGKGTGPFLALRRLGNPGGRSAIVEVYPSLWNGEFPRMGRTSDQHDAYRPLSGCAVPISTAACPDSLNHIYPPMRGRWPRSRAGSWELCNL